MLSSSMVGMLCTGVTGEFSASALVWTVTCAVLWIGMRGEKGHRGHAMLVEVRLREEQRACGVGWSSCHELLPIFPCMLGWHLEPALIVVLPVHLPRVSTTPPEVVRCSQ